MPTRLLNSSVLKWPDKATVLKAVEDWSRQAIQKHPEVTRIGFFGSYARGDWGVGSDLDMVIIVEGSNESFEKRAAGWDTTALPVPVDLLVYTQEEWQKLDRESRFTRVLEEETVWIYEKLEVGG